MKAEFFIQDEIPFFRFEGKANNAGTPAFGFEGKATEEHKLHYKKEWKEFVDANPQFKTEEEKKKEAVAEVAKENEDSSKSEPVVESKKGKKA